jgi:RNA polymerase sigma-70 factor, ECF subfamily
VVTSLEIPRRCPGTGRTRFGNAGLVLRTELRLAISGHEYGTGFRPAPIQICAFVLVPTSAATESLGLRRSQALRRLKVLTSRRELFALFGVVLDDNKSMYAIEPEVAVSGEVGMPVNATDSERSISDGEWFGGIVVELLPELFGTALRLTRNRADAEDLVAETVARAWSHLDDLADRTKLRGWLFRILTNGFLSHRRTDVRHGVPESLDENEDGFSLFEQLHAPILLWWGSPEQEFLNKLLRKDLARALDALPEPFRLVVIMADVHSCSYQEIAETLQVPIGTVRSRLARARGLLQKALWMHARDAGLVQRNQQKAIMDDNE